MSPDTTKGAFIWYGIAKDLRGQLRHGMTKQIGSVVLCMTLTPPGSKRRTESSKNNFEMYIHGTDYPLKLSQTKACSPVMALPMTNA